ncbi:MAG: guanylate kinase [Alphaproteobacteria bacterium]
MSMQQQDTYFPRRRGLLLVMSSPSGAGKTSLSRHLLTLEPDLKLSVSATTRSPRPGEEEGKDYFFKTTEEFDSLISSGALLEHAHVFGHYYGTPRQSVEDHLNAGHDVLFDIDWQGAQQLHEKMREDMVSVFILPPSMKDLERRLQTRAQDSEDIIAYRMSRAREEMRHFPEYDFVIINDDFDRACLSLRAILEAERNRRNRFIGLNDFVRKLSET